MTIPCWMFVCRKFWLQNISLLTIFLSKLEGISTACAVVWDQVSATFWPRVFPEQIRDLAGIHVDGSFHLVFLFGLVDFCLVLVCLGFFLATHVDNFMCSSCWRLSALFGSLSSTWSQVDGWQARCPQGWTFFYSWSGCWVVEYWLYVWFLESSFLCKWRWD